MLFETHPAKFVEATHLKEGRVLKESEKRTDASKREDVPLYVSDKEIISCWKTKSFIARLWFLITGKIWVVVESRSLPEMGVSIGQMFSVSIKKSQK